MRKRTVDVSSFDMLLDTMCNTFGGICFIALLIAIISANLPREGGALGDEPDIRTIEQDARVVKLTYQRDTLLSAIEAQERLKKSSQSPEAAPLKTDLERLRSSKGAAAKTLERLQEVYRQTMAQILAVGAEIRANNDEIVRLSKLADELKLKNGDLRSKQTLVARSPVKHTTSTLAPRHIIFRRGYAAMLNSHGKDNEIDFEILRVPGGLIVTPREQFGIRVDKNFTGSGLYLAHVRGATSKNSAFVSLITDAQSFEEACLVRDVLIRDGIPYNWGVYSGNAIAFTHATSFELQ